MEKSGNCDRKAGLDGATVSFPSQTGHPGKLIADQVSKDIELRSLSNANEPLIIN